MRSPRHPALRALWTVGGTPAAVTARVEVATPRLHDLTRDYGATTLLSGRLLDGLTRGIDLGAVARATEPRERPAPAHDVSTTRAASPRSPSPVGPAARLATPPPRADVRTPRVRLDDEALAARAGIVDGTTPLVVPHADSPGHAGREDPRRPARPVDDVERRERAIAAADAVATLHARAARIGVLTAANTPVGGRATLPEIAALLAPAGPNVTVPSEREPATATTATTRPLSVSPADADVSTGLSRAVARAESTRAQRTASRVVSANDARFASAPAHAVPPAVDDSTESRPHVTEPAVRGFRGLAMRMAERDRGRRSAPTPQAETVVSAVAVDRMTDAELGQRITRLLQREARRQGIALGMIE